jgi:hypothetical protein
LEVRRLELWGESVAITTPINGQRYILMTVLVVMISGPLSPLDRFLQVDIEEFQMMPGSCWRGRRRPALYFYTASCPNTPGEVHPCWLQIGTRALDDVAILMKS